MSDAEALKDLIQTSRDNLATAQDIAERTRRPNNVCDGHDALFGLIRATAIGVDASLAVLSSKLEAHEQPPMANGMGKQEQGMWPQVWAFVNSNGKSIVAWMGIVAVVIVLKGELKTVLDKMPTHRAEGAESAERAAQN